MSELDDVLAALETASDDVALATIIGVRGSKYRREGARLVVPAEGETVGNISGGCLEGDVIQTAHEVLASGAPQVLHFDLTADDEAVWGWGLGCNGAIDVLVEPAANARPFVAAMQAARGRHRAVALVTVVEGPQTGARLVVHPTGSTEGELGESARAAGLEALATGRSATVSVDGVQAFVEVLNPPLRLVVCGAGHDAIPVVEFGARLGWRVEVVDDRRGFLHGTRFPHAARLVNSQPGAAADAVQPDDRTYVIVMSHNFLRDAAYLRSFLASPAPYLGMLGPAARLDRLLDTLAAEGMPRPSERDLARLHGPAGLDVGAEGPEEIAWAIVAEILAVHRRAGAGYLRDRGGPIHPRAAMETVG
ncbi:MAG: XdhC family protein [Actinomycetota bacterium]|nr:XdhC family protein [Actinomycetota bacterium]